MKVNRLFLLSVLIIISVSTRAQDVESYLKANDLCGFIKACNYDEDLAIKKLYDYQLPDTIQYDKIWYIKHSFDEHIFRVDASVQCWLQPAVSLKQKTYCWLLKIFWKDYDNYSDKEVYFFYYDYFIIEDDHKQDVDCWSAGSYERTNNSAREKFENIIKEWYSKFSNEKYGIRAMRAALKPPFYSKDYKIIHLINWSNLLFSDETSKSGCMDEKKIHHNESKE